MKTITVLQVLVAILLAASLLTTNIAFFGFPCPSGRTIEIWYLMCTALLTAAACLLRMGTVDLLLRDVSRWGWLLFGWAMVSGFSIPFVMSGASRLCAMQVVGVVGIVCGAVYLRFANHHRR